MQRRSVLTLGALSALAFALQRLSARKPDGRLRGSVQGSALRLNQLAGEIKSEADARSYVSFIADTFSGELPSSFVSNSLLEHIAQTEFLAVTDLKKTIPEARVAAAWNSYAKLIQAPLELQVTQEEIHNLRDGLFTMARELWNLGHQTIWTAPAIYAAKADGSLASGCRAIESMRLLWDLATMPSNLTAARDRVRSGVLFSEQVRQAQLEPGRAKGGSVQVSFGQGNPVDVAERTFFRNNGARAFGRALTAMVNDTLA